MLDPEAHRPDIDLPQAVQAARGERDAVVRADGPRQAIVTKEPFEAGPGLPAFGRRQRVAAQEHPRMQIGDGQGIAVETIAGAELAFEVRGPDIVGVRGDRRDHARMEMSLATNALLDQPFRANRSPAVLRAGNRRVGWRRPSHPSSLRGPQDGCARRASQTARAASSEILCGQPCGAWLRSARPSRPCSSLPSGVALERVLIRETPTCPAEVGRR